ncbi:hypothetical protein [Microcoleus sp. S13_D1]
MTVIRSIGGVAIARPEINFRANSYDPAVETAATQTKSACAD